MQLSCQGAHTLLIICFMLRRFCFSGNPPTGDCDPTECEHMDAFDAAGSVSRMRSASAFWDMGPKLTCKTVTAPQPCLWRPEHTPIQLTCPGKHSGGLLQSLACLAACLAAAYQQHPQQLTPSRPLPLSLICAGRGHQPCSRAEPSCAVPSRG